MEARATLALKVGVWFRRGPCSLFLLIRWAQRARCQARNSTYRPVQILEAGSDIAVAAELKAHHVLHNPMRPLRIADQKVRPSKPIREFPRRGIHYPLMGV